MKYLLLKITRSYYYRACLFLILTACATTIDQQIQASDESLNEGLVMSVTKWSRHVELFAEYKPFVVGEITKFAAHFTDLRNYKPISDAKVTVSLLDGSDNVHDIIDKPLRPGIFDPTIKPAREGVYTLVFMIEFDGITDEITIPDMPVFNSMEEAEANLQEVDEGDITYLKEQAWKTNFSINIVDYQPIEDRIRAAGVVVKSPSQRTTITSVSGGILIYQKGFQLGDQLKTGDWIFTVVGKDIVGGVAAEENLNLEYLNAKAQLAHKEANYLRQKQLYEANVIPQSEFQEHELAYKIAKTEYETLANNFVDGGIQLKTPTSGYISEIWAKPGEYVSVGDPIIEVTQQSGVFIKADIPIDYFDKINLIETVRWKYRAKWHTTSVNRINHERQLDAGEVFIPVWFKLNNTNLLPGEYLEIEAIIKSDKKALAVPTTALLEDFGVYSVVVQITGESFEIRNIIIGTKNSEYTEVISGLEPGEVIVVNGAYQVKMASMAGDAPTHGHPH